MSLHGTGCRIEIGQGSRQNKPTIQALGFFTTRFVEAASAEEAARRTTGIVQEELRKLNQSARPPKILVESVVEDEAGYAKYAPGGGFTWYREDASADQEKSQ